MKGSTYRRCSCRDPKTGKELGTSCPKRNSRNHCTYSIRQELPPREEGSRRSFARGGYDSRKAAQADLDHVQRRAAIDGLAAVPWKGANNRARRKAMKAAIDAMPPFRRITGPATRLHVKATLRAALNDAIGQQIITFNPAAHVEIDPVRKPKALVWTDERVAKWEQTGEKPSPVMVWTPKQTGAFLDFVAEDRLYAMWHLIAFRGLRRGEACGQPWSETNLDTHSLTVSSQLVQDGWEIEASDPKTDSGYRMVALDDDTVNVLKQHRERQSADREEWGSAWVDTGNVFAQEDGSWLHPGKVTDLFERLVAASGLPPIRLHDLRHGAATLMLAADIDIKIVSDTLGHSDTRITRDIYQNPRELHLTGEKAQVARPGRRPARASSSCNLVA